MWPFTARRTRADPRKESKLDGLWGFMRGDLSLESSEAIFAAVSRISNSIASLPCHLWRGHEMQYGDPRELLVSYMPSFKLSAFDLQHTWHACCEATGNGYILKVPGESGGTAALDVINPAYVEPLLARETGEVWYRLTPPDGPEMYVHGREMLHIRHVCVNGLKGINPVRVLRGTLEYDDKIKEFSLSQVSGVNSCVMLEIPSALKEEKRRGIIDQFLSGYKRSNGSLIILDAGVKGDVLNKSPVDAHVLDIDRITISRVASVYTIPPHMLGDYSNTSYESNEQESLDYVKHTLLPRIARAEAEMNRKLLSCQEFCQGFRWKYDMDEILRADSATRAECDVKLVRGMVLKPNEARVLRGLNPDDAGDILYGSRDLAPAAMIKAGNARNTRRNLDSVNQDAGEQGGFNGILGD